MTTPSDIVSIVDAAARERTLRPRNDLREPGWRFWELRTLNRHRVIGLLNAARPFTDARDLEAEIRGGVSRNFKTSWWRGMAYGVVAQVPAIATSPEDLRVLVDVRESSKGTLQWVILTASHASVALGVHTWMEAYLSPAYRSTLRGLTERGYRVSTATREKDGLMKLLTSAADWRTAALSLGSRREAFPEFRDRP